MTIEVEVLIEAYTTLKEYIPTKERQAAADNLISLLVDNLSDRELREFGSTDGYTKRAIEEYLDDDTENDEDLDDY